MQSQVLWAIDEELGGAKFERLCVDLLYRNGYKDIIPIEPQDGGRDAEELPRKGRDRDGFPSYFQFSLESGWKTKVRRDAAKLAKRGAQFTYLVFVTSRRVRGVDIDQLRTEFRKNYGWILVVYSREWLRLQLEEANPDLSKKYLGIRVTPKPSNPILIVGTNGRRNAGMKPILRAMDVGAYAQVVALLVAYLDAKPESAVGWQLLAWAEYRQERFDEALSHINRALKLLQEPQFELVRACILAEKGIRDRSKRELLLAEKLFRGAIEIGESDGGMEHYNLGNVLSALRQYPEAIEQFKLALKLEKNRPEIWKNLGSAYHEFGDYSEEMKCLDRALELDPLLPEALASKAVSFITDLSKPQEAIPLLEAAYRAQPNISIRWPKFWYWLVTSCFDAGELAQAYRWIEEGLNHQPGSRSLSGLKSRILLKLRQVGANWDSQARTYWADELAAEPMNFEARRQLVRAEFDSGNEVAAWVLVDECLPLFDLGSGIPLRALGIDVNTCLDALEVLPQYIRYRSSMPLKSVWEPKASKAFSKDTNLAAQMNLIAYLAIPFGLSYRQLDQQPADLTTFFDVMREPLIAAFVSAAKAFSPSIFAVAGDAQQRARLATCGGSVLADAAQYEFSRMASWIPGAFGIDEQVLTKELTSYPKLVVALDVLTQSVIGLMRPHLPEERHSKISPKRPPKQVSKTVSKSRKRVGGQRRGNRGYR
jgi:tetratricopeptide (TPR) repeat protein